ncbi:MAG TPA: hypothetical protein PKE26_04800 [Kiritimatiellia bacterium]|nr:hypothetical protein [Kiritimatiellia bacterium]HMO98409.1 hypothetical protein [Kiritimatiellia bacterium]HMP96462.1 hypothetical protein [Kiritimatiellia bacterium]
MHPEQIKIFRAMSPAKKLELAGQFILFARQVKAQALKQEHPDWPESRIQQEVRRWFLYAPQ